MARKTKPASRAPLFVAVCGFALVAGLAAYVVNNRGRSLDQNTSEPTATSKRPQDVKVYTPRYDKGDLKLDSKTARPTAAEDPRVFAVNKYLEQLAMVPKAARAKTCTVTDGIANLDFTLEFEKTYGTEDEQTILKGLLTVMAQFPEVHQVKFTVGGRTLDTLGNVDLTTPQDVMKDPQPAPPSGG
jgi:hypothetical protein